MPTTPKRIPTALTQSVTALLEGVTLEKVKENMPKAAKSKSAGGRGYKTTESSYLKRIPNQYVEAVEALIDAYYCPLERVTIQELQQFFELDNQLENFVMPEPYDWDNPEANPDWLALQESLNFLQDKIVRILKQIDNNHINDYDYLEYLLKYNLIVPVTGYKVVTAKTLIDWITSLPGESIGKNIFEFSVETIVREAIRHNRLEMIASLEIGKEAPIDRQSYWANKYTSELGKPYTHYFDWKANPESLQVCPELTLLLTLPEPSKDVKKVLDALLNGGIFSKSGTNPFTKGKQEYHPGNLISIQGHGALANDKDAEELQRAFIQLYREALTHVDEESIIKMFERLYNCTEGTLKQMLRIAGSWFHDLLQIDKYATKADIKVAYRKLAKIHHPDNGGNAEMFREINEAYQAAID